MSADVLTQMYLNLIQKTFIHKLPTKSLNFEQKLKKNWFGWPKNPEKWTAGTLRIEKRVGSGWVNKISKVPINVEEYEYFEIQNAG